MRFLFLVFILCLGWPGPSMAQEITLGKEYNYNSEDGFILMGKVKDTILLYTEKGFDRTIAFFDDELGYLFSKELILEEPRVHINLAVARERDFTLIYSYQERFTYLVKAVKFNLRGIPIDTMTLFRERDILDLQPFSYVLSEDRNQVVLFREQETNRLECLFFDLEAHQLNAVKEWRFSDLRVDSELRALVLSNAGHLALLFEKYNYSYRRNRHFHHLFIYDAFGNERNHFQVSFPSVLSVSFNVDRDERNDRYLVSGIYAPRSLTRGEGYYYYAFDENGLWQDPIFERFPGDLLAAYSGREKDPKKYIPDLVVREMVIRNDGGFVMVAEMQKEVYRESVRRRYIDYHYEDLVILAVEPDGSLFWSDLIRKYQMSYDDRARYSSFFLFETPSRLNIIYNDEIKNENTISQYTFSPVGKGKRTSLFSTDLHRLKILFEDAVQLDSHSFAVPSMTNGKYRIVRIRFGG